MLNFLTVILTWIGNKDKPEECKHIKVFDGYLDKDLVKDIERIAFSSNNVVIASDENKGKDFSNKYRPNDRGRIQTDTRANYKIFNILKPVLRAYK